MTRDLTENSKQISRQLSALPEFAASELAKSYASALDDIRSTLARIYDQYNVTGELTKAQRTQFLRLSNIEKELIAVLQPYLSSSEELIKQVSQIAVDQSYLRHGWAIDQAAGVQLGWGGLSDNAVRAVSIGGTSEELRGIVSDKELIAHRKLLDDAFKKNWPKDSKKWLSNAIKDGVIKGDSIPTITKAIKGALGKTYSQAEIIARTEILRALGIGSQIAYDKAADDGVQITQVWDATLDSRTRPEHAALDGRSMVDGMFDTAVGFIPGPRRSGDASFDINCRCSVNGEVEGFAPSVRRIRDEGIVPYKTFTKWAQDNGIAVNKYGQKYDFLNKI